MQMREMLIAAAYTLSWMCASSGLILLNKYILSNLDFHYPLALSRCASGVAAARQAARSVFLTPRASRRALAPTALVWAFPRWHPRCLSTC